MAARGGEGVGKVDAMSPVQRRPCWWRQRDAHGLSVCQTIASQEGGAAFSSSPPTRCLPPVLFLSGAEFCASNQCGIQEKACVRVCVVYRVGGLRKGVWSGVGVVG